MIKAEKREGKIRFSKLGEKKNESPKQTVSLKQIYKNRRVSEGGYLPLKNAKRIRRKT